MIKAKLIYPVWRKLRHQPEFFLPPHGPVVFAASLPPEVEVSFTDENIQPIDFSESCDLVFISVMLTCQIKRAWEIADRFRAAGKTVIFGGIATQLHGHETREHADSVFLGESEGRMTALLEDFKRGKLKPVYDFHQDFPDTSLIGTARRDILNREAYNFRGVQMVDLVHASRGCRFNCFPCCTPFLGGRTFRPRPIDKVIEEMESIDNQRLFMVDNSLAQDDQWEKDLFREMAPLKKKWVSHPIKDDDEILALAAAAGAWYVYQAVIDTSDHIRRRIKRYKDHGIGVEGTIILGTDEHDCDYIKRLVDFLMDVDLDLAEFTVMTPFPHTPIRDQLEQEGRILHSNWEDYTCDRCVFQPAKMTPDELETMYDYAWETFYSNCSKELQMAKLYLKALDKKQRDHLRARPHRSGSQKWGGIQ